MLQHERMSVAMALAEKLHHSAQRPEMARAGEEESELNFTAAVRTTPPPQPVLFSLFDEEPGGRRPASLAEPPRPQERVQRHTVEHIVDLVRVAPMVQILDAPVPQTVEQLPDILRFFDTLPDPEQVIEVPKISPEDVSMRTAVRAPQLAEQLVEVPTIVSWSLLKFIMEQNVDIPVPGRGGGISGLQGFLPGQSSTALWCGVVWCGVVCGVVWCGVVWRGVVCVWCVCVVCVWCVCVVCVVCVLSTMKSPACLSMVGSILHLLQRAALAASAAICLKTS